MRREALILFLALQSSMAFGAAFSTCPSKAFLIQDTTAKLYGVNLVSGDHTLLSDSMNTSGKINGMGFNFHDNYLYGFGYEAKNVVRIGDDYQAEALSATGLPNTNFYVGDISLSENAYYVYRKGGSYGLYKIPLDPLDANYLQATRVIDGGSLNLNIYDLAFNPVTNEVYSVDGGGNLHRINVSTGGATSLGNVGVSGTFGAVYFDVNQNLYISRNSDGVIFRIAIGEGATTAEHFTYGPSSGNNDGARCAMAAVVDEDSDPTVDYGDAPDTYGTSLDSNGPRHGVSGLYLGSLVDAEHHALVSPSSDEGDQLADDDGIGFVSVIESGQKYLLQIESNGSGYLNAWLDWNQNGQFDSGEQIITDMALTGGINNVLLDAPSDLVEGMTWARFRYSSTAGIGPTGGVSDGEVEDYSVYITSLSLSAHYNANTTVAFEDSWPRKGDYDMNDLVSTYDSTVYVNDANNVEKIIISGTIIASGASYHNGFAIHFPGIATGDVSNSLSTLTVNGAIASHDMFEAASTYLSVVISPDVEEAITKLSGCSFYRTESSAGCAQSIQYSFEAQINVTGTVPYSSMPVMPFDPYIFGVSTHYHGDDFSVAPSNALEIHLKNKAPTNLFNTDYFGLGDDRSSVASGVYFLTDTGLPWAISVSDSWVHPYEFKDISEAYPDFINFVTTAGGENGDWYLSEKANSALIYSN